MKRKSPNEFSLNYKLQRLHQKRREEEKEEEKNETKKERKTRKQKNKIRERYRKKKPKQHDHNQKKMIKVMNLLYKFRGTINSTSSLRMPKPALITKKSGSIWIERTEKMEDLADIDESEKVDPIWIFGYRFHEKGDEEADNGVIFLERIGSDDDEEEVEKDKDEKENPKKKIHQLAPIESITISSVIHPILHKYLKTYIYIF